MSRVVCTLCGLVAETETPIECQHPGWPNGPGFAPGWRPAYLGMRGRARATMVPYAGSVQAGLTDPDYHVLMAANG